MSEKKTKRTYKKKVKNQEQKKVWTFWDEARKCVPELINYYSHENEVNLSIDDFFNIDYLLQEISKGNIYEPPLYSYTYLYKLVKFKKDTVPSTRYQKYKKEYQYFSNSVIEAVCPAFFQFKI